MSEEVEVSFPTDGDHRPFGQRLQDISERLSRKDRLSYNQRLVLLNDLSDSLLAKRSQLPTNLANAGLGFLLAFLRTSNLSEIVKRQVPNPLALEHFVPLDGRKSLRILPKGIVCHWIAGNVPLLGMFSWAISALLGNVNVIRISSKQNDLVSPLLCELSNLSTDGRLLAEETLLACFDRNNRSAHEQMSRIADVRIAWGGHEAIEAIKTLPCQWKCEDIALGPRVSLAVIDPQLPNEKYISRLATDAVFFDQQACSSPQIVFVKGCFGDPALDAFVEQFASAFDQQSAVYPRHRIDFGETYQIQLDRARVLLEGGRVLRDAQTRWTIALGDRPVPRVHCANRFIQLIPFESFEFVCEHIPDNVQTVITHLSKNDSEQFTENASRLGVCRFPAPGEGNHFEVPWDGIPLVSRLTRWVLRTNPQLD